MFVQRLQQPQFKIGFSRKVSVAAVASKVSVADLRRVAEGAAAAGAEVCVVNQDAMRANYVRWRQPATIMRSLSSSSACRSTAAA
jgi:hypothetical protein